MTPQEAMVLLDRGFDKLSSKTAKLGTIRHPDQLNEILNAIRPACMGVARPQPQAPTNRIVDPARVAAENNAIERGAVCTKCECNPCECTWQGRNVPKIGGEEV